MPKTLSLETIKIIQNEYLKPFLKEAEKVASPSHSINNIIDEAIKSFEILAPHINFQPGGFTCYYVRMPKWFDFILASNESFKKYFKNLQMLYWTGQDIIKIEDLVLPPDKIYLQTIIRKFLFDSISPIEQLKIPDVIDTKCISNNQAKTQQTDLLTNLPDDIKNNIYSNLDNKSIISYKRLSKTFYFHQKICQDKQSNIFYAVVDNVRITQNHISTGFFSPSHYKSRKKIPPHEMIHAFTNPNLTEVKLFSLLSLYETIEYANHRRHGGQPENFRPGFVPAIFKVVYGGNVNSLQFETIEINISERYNEGRERKSIVSYAIADKEILQPLSGTVIAITPNFSEYQKYPEVHFKQPIPTNNNIFDRFNIRIGKNGHK